MSCYSVNMSIIARGHNMCIHISARNSSLPEYHAPNVLLARSEILHSSRGSKFLKPSPRKKKKNRSPNVHPLKEKKKYSQMF